MLTRAVTVAVSLAGLDPQLGFLHTPRGGRPALALDLMEPLRPLVADSVVLSLINNRRLAPEDFVVQDDAVLLGSDGRRRLIAAFEQRLSQEIEHPAFARPLAYREWLSAQARPLGDRLTGARADFPQLRPR
jgi:CRISP-associated protein Cas1